MNTQEMYNKISEILELDEAERLRLEEDFPDPLSVKGTVRDRTPMQLCADFGSRGKVYEVGAVIKEYREANSRVPYSQLDEE